ncbi:hypothetical protein HanXRQr2_Chr01g0015011 [Helianthus annuus]|uniref:Uncharacterized protein n=1 Tax=Helianthus annuus TaxID=4232 RepID=A0A9K3P304_HELAN|nr:hypothetical protein HanXRQr2_Chr01g0015011 [Helianthus annuus]KAJ0956417.1 hypothetical protein HanPSC8_Chr01g0014541 [Helianthus annuus]
MLLLAMQLISVINYRSPCKISVLMLSTILDGYITDFPDISTFLFSSIVSVKLLYIKILHDIKITDIPPR